MAPSRLFGPLTLALCNKQKERATNEPFLLPSVLLPRAARTTNTNTTTSTVATTTADADPTATTVATTTETNGTIAIMNDRTNELIARGMNPVTAAFVEFIQRPENARRLAEDLHAWYQRMMRGYRDHVAHTLAVDGREIAEEIEANGMVVPDDRMLGKSRFTIDGRGGLEFFS